MSTFIPLSVFEEFRASAIPDNLTQANVSWVEGEQAVRILSEQAIANSQKVQSYLTKPATRILANYQFAEAGGWVAYGTQLDGGGGTVAYFKPATPRSGFKGFDKAEAKLIKYETPAKCEALPILPYVDSVTAAEIYSAYGVEPEPGETFWQVVKRCNLPIALTEGLKKALSLIAHGTPAIALRGITCWHKKGNSERLHDVIADFVTQQREIKIFFDQDENPKTQNDVRKQILGVSKVLEAGGVKVFVARWDKSQGKGIDDALFTAGDRAKDWLDFGLFLLSIKDYRKEGWQARAIATIDRLNRLSFPIERATEGEYLPVLPEVERGAIHVISADMNTGKTTRIGRDWVNPVRESGWNVLVLCPLNSLGQQAANDWGLPHIHDFGTSLDQQRALWAAVSHQHGLVCCPESLHRLPQWFWDRPLLLVIEEANQTISTEIEGDTLGSRYSDILLRLSDAAKYAIQNGAIVISEAGIPDRAVKFIQSLSGSESVRVFTHQKQGQPWPCWVYSGQKSGFRSRLLFAAGEGVRILYVTSSQREAKVLQRALPASLNVVRIDSETNQQGEFTDFFNNPDQWLQQHKPDVLILSPSAKSGVSIEGGVPADSAYFDEVWGYFPALDTDTHLQLLGRERPAVPRHIFVPPFILGSGDESLANPRAIRRRLDHNLRAMAAGYGLAHLLEEDARDESLLQVEDAIFDYLVASRAVSGAQKSIAYDALIRQLEKAGHLIQTEKLDSDKEISELWKQLREEIWREEADLIAATEINPTLHTQEWAYQNLSSSEASKETRTIAHKVLWRSEFPGLDFNSPEECYEGLCSDYGAMRRGVLLHARAENLQASKEDDRKAANAILEGQIRAVHRLPKSHIKAVLLAKTGILELLDGNYSNQDPRAIAVKHQALKFAKEIEYWLRLQVKEDQTPVSICNKLLKKLGLEGKAISRPGRRGKQVRIYRVTGQDNPIRLKLLEAQRRKLSESVSMIRRDLIPNEQIMDTPLKTNVPLTLKGRFRRRGSLAVWLVEAVNEETATIYQESGWAASCRFQVPIAELEAIA